MIDCGGVGVRVHPAAVGDFAAARTGPERALLAADAAHSAVADGHGEQRALAGRPGPRVRADGDAAAVPRRPQRPHRHHRAHDLPLAIVRLPQKVLPPGPLPLRPGTATASFPAIPFLLILI